jgi:hypothetical protein
LGIPRSPNQSNLNQILLMKKKITARLILLKKIERLEIKVEIEELK